MKEFASYQKDFKQSEKSWSIEANTLNCETFDLSVKNPNTPEEDPLRHPQEILAEINLLDQENEKILEKIKELI